jgi:hypothetical protein
MSRVRRSKVVETADDIPAFKSEDEEAQFWSTHELGGELLERMGSLGEDVLPPPRTRSRAISIRFDEELLDRLKALAARRGKGYQTLVKQFLVERLYEEEQRERERDLKPPPPPPGVGIPETRGGGTAEKN